MTPYFFTVMNIRNILLQSAVMGILAAGFTIVLIAGEIDLSLATAQALAGTVAALLIIKGGYPVVPGIILAILLGLLVGFVNGYFSVYVKIPSFIVTLATLSITQGLAFVIASGRTIGGFPDSYKVIGQGSVGGIPIPVIFFIVIYIILHLVLTQTKFGLKLYAVGGSRTTANRVGINTNRIIMTAFLISGVLTAIGGLVLSSRLNAGHGTFGATLLLDVVAAVIIGGTALTGGAGSLIGTFAGVIIITTTRNGLVLLGIDPFWQQVAVGWIILVAVTADQIIKGHIGFREFAPFLRHFLTRRS
jgi:ribose/xylose/arabinose/galactoside ABC-type transport system permease subunit